MKHRKRLDRKGAAEYINKTVSTLDKWRSERVVLPFYKDARAVWYYEDDLDAYLEACRVEPVAYRAK